MARSVTVATLITRIRELTDTEGMDTTNGFFSDAELIRKIDMAYAELYDLLVSKGVGQYESTSTISGTGVSEYPLPSDFYACLGVDLILDASRSVDLLEVDIHDRNMFSTTAGKPVAYRIHGSKIEFYPPLASGESCKLFYAPTAGVLDETTDSLDGVNGWEEFIVFDVAYKAMITEESFELADRFKAEKQDLIKRINEMSENRIKGPLRVRDTKTRYYSDPADYRWR